MSELTELTNQVSELKATMNTINDKINDLDATMITINDKLDKLLTLFESQNTDSKKMSDHIDFIETVYEKVKTPFNYIMNAVSTTYAITDGTIYDTTE